MSVEHRRRPVIHTDLSVYLALAELRQALDLGEQSPPIWIFAAARAGELTSDQVTILLKAMDRDPRIGEALIEFALQRPKLGPSLQSERPFLFDGLVVGRTNIGAFSQIKSRLEPGTEPNPRPLFITGQAGSGKSHLLGLFAEHLRNSGQASRLTLAAAHEVAEEWSTLSSKQALDHPQLWLVDDADRATPDQLSTLLGAGPKLCRSGHRVVICGQLESDLERQGPNTVDLLQQWDIAKVASPDADIIRSLIRSECYDKDVELTTGALETLTKHLTIRPELIHKVLAQLLIISSERGTPISQAIVTDVLKSVSSQ